MKILVIDDDKTILKLVKILLSSHHEVVIAESGEEGLELFAKGDINMVITDYLMPGKSGIDVLKEIHKQDKDIPVIIVTGEADEDSAIEAVNHGAYAYLRKPFEQQQLVEMTLAIGNEQQARATFLKANKEGVEQLAKLAKSYEEMLAKYTNS